MSGQTPPTWLSDSLINEENDHKLHFVDAPYTPASDIQESEWFGGALTMRALKKLRPDNVDHLRCVFPNVTFGAFINYVEKYNIPVEICDGFETVYRSKANNGWPCTGCVKFRFRDNDFIGVICSSTNFTDPCWWLLCEDIKLAHDLCTVVKAAMKQPKRYCYTITNCTERNDNLLKEIDLLTWDDLVMDRILKDDLKLCCESVFNERNGTVFDRMRLPRKKGVILYGPPGNGKTLTGKVVASALKTSIVYVSAIKQDTQNKERKSAEIIEEAFDIAQTLSPCVLVFEEIDGLMNDPASRPILLTQMDGLKSNEGILTVATTNFIEKLDPAIVNRPSRFDRLFLFDHPSPKVRRDYLSTKIRQAFDMLPGERFKPSLTAALSKTVNATEGMSFSHLQEVVLDMAAHICNKPEMPPSRALNLASTNVVRSFTHQKESEHKKED